ncbi:MAG: hypothetical protein IPN97_09715 [Saprospiraceae bacterium]|nr:hypothetical protein [Saprospiraceae bacterium]
MKLEIKILLLIKFIIMNSVLFAQKDTIPSGLDKIIDKVRKGTENSSAGNEKSGNGKNVFGYNNVFDSLAISALYRTLYLCYAEDKAPSSIRKNIATNKNVFLGVSVGGDMYMSDEILNLDINLKQEQKNVKTENVKLENKPIECENYFDQSKIKLKDVEKANGEFISFRLANVKSNISLNKNKSEREFIVVTFKDTASYEFNISILKCTSDELINKTTFKTGGLVFTFHPDLGSVSFSLFANIKNQGKSFRFSIQKMHLQNLHLKVSQIIIKIRGKSRQSKETMYLLFFIND